MYVSSVIEGALHWFYTLSSVTHHEEDHSACENSCKMSSVALEELFKVWQNDPDYVKAVSSGLSQPGLENYRNRQPELQNGVVKFERYWHLPGGEGQGTRNNTIQVHYGKCRIQGFFKTHTKD